MHSAYISNLFQIENPETHDVRYFAMFNNAVAVSGNKRLEGGRPSEALAYYNYLLNIQLPNCPLGLNLSDRQLKAVKNRLDKLEKMNTLLKKLFSTQSLFTKEGLDKVINKVEKNCKNDDKAVCYLPSGYTNKEDSHFAGLKVRKLKNGHYAFSCINQGEGMNFHQKISISSTKVKSSYQSDEYEIDLQSEDGREFLQKMLELCFDTKRTHETSKLLNPYSSEDLYGLLKLYGKKILSPTPEEIKEKGVTPQRTGSCSITNTHAMAKDALIDNKADFKTRKRYHFVMKLRSIIAGFDSYCKGQYSLDEIEWALAEFSIRINKQYRSILNDEEMIYCSNLQAKIKYRLNKDKEESVKQLCDPKLYPEITGEAPRHSQNIFNLSKIKTTKEESAPEKIKFIKTISRYDIRPETIKELLTIDEEAKSFPFKKIYGLFNLLPHCSGLEADEFWDKVPQADIKDIIANLFTIIKQLSIKSADSSLKRAQTFTLALMAHDIVAQLGPRYSGFKLGSKYTFGLDDIYSEQYFFNDPICYHTIKRIAKNFEQRAENKERIFTNAINYAGNKYDHTVNYVINVLLTAPQHTAVAYALMKSEGKNHADYTDEQLFGYLMQHLDLRDYDGHPILDESVIKLIAIAATSHAMGDWTSKYKNEKNIWYFAENQFHREVKRKDRLASPTYQSDLDKHLPVVSSTMSADDFKDYSENTIYHPHDNLITNRENGYYWWSSIDPYQPQLSGSLRPDLAYWRPEPNKKFIYEELNEELRTIECSPNFQVAKALDWSANHPDKLTYKEVRKRINEFLFQYGKLDSAFTNQLETTLFNMQRFLVSVIEFCKEEAPEEKELLIWATSLANDFRYHLEVAAKLYHLPITEFTLPSFNPLLLHRIQNEEDTDTKSMLASQLILNFRNISPLSVEDCCLLLACRVAANLGDEGGVSQEIWQSLSSEIIATLSSRKDEAEIKLNELFSSYKLTTIKEWRLVDSQLQAPGVDLYIDLSSGSLRGKGELLAKKECTAKTIAKNKELFDQLHLSITDIKLYYSDKSDGQEMSDKVLQSDDGKFEFIFSSSWDKFKIESTYKKFNIEGTIKKFQLLDKEKIGQFFGELNPFESKIDAGTHYQYWQCTEDNDLILAQYENDDIIYSYTKDHDLILMTPNNKSDLDLEKLRKLSEKNNNNPILINWEGKISLYGFSENTWSMMSLDDKNEVLMKALKEATFPKKEIVNTTHLEKLRLRREKFVSEGRDTESIDEWIAEEEEKIEKKKEEIAVSVMKSDKSIKSDILQEVKRLHSVIKSKAINQLALQKSGEWQRSGRLLLNLVNPQTAHEQHWAARLGSMFDAGNVRCIATLSEDKSSCHLEHIEHISLGLNFSINDKNRFMCHEYPEFYLSDQPSLETVNGIASVIILENDNSEKKYLIPAFSLHKGEDNNALNYKALLDFESFCNKSQPYFSYTLTSENELISDSVEGNLYLAILYRSMGNFDRAIKYLDRCKKHDNIDAKIGVIAMQIMKRKMISPTGAAFDLKLACYVKEHQEKWSKDKSITTFEMTKDWNKFIESQLEFYNKTFSSYKSEVAIIPSYCRLTSSELSLLGFSQIAAMQVPPEPSKRFESTCQLHDLDRWEQIVDRDIKHINQEAPDLTTLRLYGNRGCTLSYLVKNFQKLFKNAISDTPSCRDHFNRTLFALIQNEAELAYPETYLIALLIHAREYVNYFKEFEIPSDNIELIKNVGKVLYENKIDTNKKVYLFQFETNPYVLSQEASLPSDFTNDPVIFSVAPISYEKKCMHPLADIGQQYFTRDTEPVATNDFALQEPDLINPTLLTKKIFERLKTGHEKNKIKMKAVYSLITGKTLTNLKSDLKARKERDESEIKAIKVSLLKRANLTPLDDPDASISQYASAYNLLQARASGQKHEITIDELFTAYLYQNPSLLTEQNPFLTQKDIEQLFSELSNYALLHSRIDQTKQALDEIGDKTTFTEEEKYKEQLLAGILDKPRAYKIEEYPEFLVFEYATHRILRDDQVLVLKNLIELIEKGLATEEDIRHALLQFPAGAGKTSVLISILAPRFARKDLLPVIINTNELYEIGLEDIPKNLRASFNQRLEVIERELDHKWTILELEKLLADMSCWRTERKCLLIKSVTWHSINIAMKSAYFNHDPKLADAAQRVLDFFKYKTVKLEDECHIVSDPMQQSIKTNGKPHNIPSSQLNLLLHCYDYLLGREPNSRDIAKLAGIKSHRKRSISPEELNELQSKLANALINEDFFKDIPHEDLIKYLIPADKTDKTRPAWLEDLCNGTEKQQELGDLIVLSRAFIYSHLPHILSQQYLKDYGESIHEGDLTVAPKHEGNNVSSHFGDHTLVASLTIQLYEQRGLLPEQVDQLLDQLVKEHKKERLWNHDFSKPTKAELWLRNNIPSIKSFRDITKEVKNVLKNDKQFSRNPQAIRKYLREFALPQIKVPSMRITSTAADMQAGFTRSIMLSATPSIPEIYPSFLDPGKNCFLDEAFEAQVIDTLLQKQNRQLFVLKKSQTPTEFFSQFPEELLKNITTLIDRGSLLTHFKAKDVITAYLDMEKSHIPTQTAAFFSKAEKHTKQKMHLVSKSPDVKSQSINGAALIEALKKQGIKPEDFLLFLFLDLSKTTGTDIARPHRDKAGLTVGMDQTLTETIQAAMRQRKLLDKNAQSIAWLMLQALYREINPGIPEGSNVVEHFDPIQLFYWMLKNEANKLESKLISRAYQDIYQAISGLAWKEVASKPEIIDTTKKGLEQEQQLSPSKIYELPSKMDKTENVLRKYVNTLLQKFKVDEEELPPETKLRINKVIYQTSHLIPELQDPPKTQLGIEVEQEMQQAQEAEEEQQQEVLIKNKNDSNSDFVFQVEQYCPDTDNLTAIFSKSEDPSKQWYQKPRLQGCEGVKLPELLLNPNHFTVIKQNDMQVDSPIVQMKPIYNLLLRIMPDNQIQFVACTAAGIEYYGDLINKNHLTEKYPAYAIIGISGGIFQKSNNLSLMDVRKLIESKECQKMLTYAQLLNGEISNPIILSQIAKEKSWNKDQYERLERAITDIHVSHQPVALIENEIYEIFESYCGWSNKKPAAPMVVDTEHGKLSDEHVSTTPQQTLRPMDTLENYIEKTLRPIVTPQHTLGCDLLGKTPQPIGKILKEPVIQAMQKHTLDGFKQRIALMQTSDNMSDDQMLSEANKKYESKLFKQDSTSSSSTKPTETSHPNNHNPSKK